MVKNTRRFVLSKKVNKMEDSPKKKQIIENEKKKKGKQEETEKIRTFTRNKVQKQRGDIFSNVGEVKKRRYKNLTQKGDVKHNSNFHFFENQFILLFQKWTKKESQKNVRLFKTKVFLFEKVEKTKKAGDAKVDKKTPKTIATIRKDKRNKTKCAYTKKDNKVKNGGKRIWKKRR